MLPVAFINADMGPGSPATVRIQGARIIEITDHAATGDLIVDLEGDRLLPGLINAHDHLQLNGFPTPEYCGQYQNAGEWIVDFNERIGVGSAFLASKAVPRDTRLLQGGFKNLLSGVTTVAHHDPLYPVLLSESYPTQVVEKYGWSHSLGIDTEESVRRSYLETPAEQPWIIHAAEGIDAAAAAEFDRLEALGCLGPNSLLVHGVALDEARRGRLAEAGAGLVWCPTSNLRLFGATTDVTSLAKSGCVALGTDSRLTGARDLLEELQVAAEVAAFDDATLESLVTVSPARLLRLPDRGTLHRGARADIVVLRAETRSANASRQAVRIVMSGGVMYYGDTGYARLLMPESQRVNIHVDGSLKVMERRVAAPLLGGAVVEAGVELPNARRRAG